MSSFQPRKQRKALYNAPHHVARKQIASHLAEPLLVKYNRRSITLIVGDEVKVMRGQYAGETGKVVSVDVPARKVIVEHVVNKKADGTEVPRPIAPSNLLIVKLNLDDKQRREKLGETQEAEKSAKKPKGKSAKAEPKAGKAEATKAPQAEPKTEKEVAA